MNFNNRDMGPVSMGCCRLLLDLLETDSGVCFLTIVRLTVVILLSWLFAISASCPHGDVIVTWNIGSHRKPSAAPLSQGVQVGSSPTHKQFSVCQNVIGLTEIERLWCKQLSVAWPKVHRYSQYRASLGALVSLLHHLKNLKIHTRTRAKCIFLYIISISNNRKQDRLLKIYI